MKKTLLLVAILIPFSLSAADAELKESAEKVIANTKSETSNTHQQDTLKKYEHYKENISWIRSISLPVNCHLELCGAQLFLDLSKLDSSDTCKIKKPSCEEMN
jgi:hypothetical protein